MRHPERCPMAENDENTLCDSEVALMDAIKTVLEIIIAKKISAPSTLAQIFQLQSKSYPKEQMPKAVFVMESLRDFVNDPERQAQRERAERLSREPPSGSA
jgi:hypothetical protein